MDEDFHSDDWRVRFAAVEKVTVIFRFLDDKPVKKSAALRSVLSHAFCCLIACMDDITPHVSQVWTLTQLYSVEFSRSRIDVKKCVFNKHTIKVCVSCS